jgi:hypothetical protein
MITVDQPALQQSLQRWNSYIAGKIDFTHLAGKEVVRVEAGRLVQTLIKVTPPAEPARTRESIEGRVDRTFQVLGTENGRSWVDLDQGGKHGYGDVAWYAFQSNAIFGVARDADMTGASAAELYAVYQANKRQNKQGRIIAGRRGKQTVYIWKKITTLASEVRKLKTRLKSHVGRLKAGWCPAWDKLGQPRGTYAPPRWVTDHNVEGKVQGYAINLIDDPRFPQFTLENHAKGAGSDTMNGLVKTALDIRSKAMVKRMTFLVKHPEKLGEETA